MKTLSLLLALSLAFPGANAQAEIFSVIVKLGGEAVKLLIEKRGDMLVAIVGGAIVTVGDHALSAVLENKDVKSDDPAAKSSSCVKIGTGVMTCPDDVKMAGETPATQEQINRALTGLHSNFGISTALAAEPKHPFVQFHNTTNLGGNPFVTTEMGKTKLIDMTKWLTVKNSTVADDYQDYLNQFPNGQFAGLAKHNEFTFSMLQASRAAAALSAVHLPASVPDPATAALVPKPCNYDQESILRPVRAIIEAQNEKDIDKFAAEWFDVATYKTYTDKIHQNRDELLDARRQEFASWKSAKVALADGWRVNLDPKGTATVHNKLTMDITFANGERVIQEPVETYTLACGMSGSWRILENIDYLVP